MRFAAIDFETANNFIGSICAVGIAVMDDSYIVDKKYWLIKPHEDYRHFDPFNVMIHGISKDMVADAEEFDAVYTDEILPLLDGAVVLAHNAAFDMSALRHVLDLYGIEYPDIRYICTYKAALRTWDDLENYKLNTISEFLDFRFEHHNALEDALACANVLRAVIKEKDAADFIGLLSALGMRAGRLFSCGYSPCSIGRQNYNKSLGIAATTDRFDEEHEFYRKKIAFTGTLLSMKRKDAMQKVADAGGYISDAVTEDTDFLVMGTQDYGKFSNGRESSKTQRAKALISEGRKIQIIDEKEFIKMI